VAVEKKISEQILAPEPLFYYSFRFTRQKRCNSFFLHPTTKTQKTAVDIDIKHPLNVCF
jgi:hypothetical protein